MQSLLDRRIGRTVMTKGKNHGGAHRRECVGGEPVDARQAARCRVAGHGRCTTRFGECRLNCRERYREEERGYGGNRLGGVAVMRNGAAVTPPWMAGGPNMEEQECGPGTLRARISARDAGESKDRDV